MSTIKEPKNIFVKGPILPETIAASIAGHSSKTGVGAHAIFLGQIRADKHGDSTVCAIEYTAYEEMALQLAHEIRESVFAKYPLTCVHVYHSLGEVKAGEICLFVFVSSARRHAAIDACNELVERIKSELPIWGKEILESKTFNWKINH